jgi:hypothetical protein
MKRTTGERRRRIVWLEPSKPDEAYCVMMSLLDETNTAEDEKPQQDTSMPSPVEAKCGEPGLA